MKRVVVTGIGGITAFGNDWQKIKTAFQRKQNAVKSMNDWVERFPELDACLGAVIEDYYPRNIGTVSNYAV